MGKSKLGKSKMGKSKLGWKIMKNNIPDNFPINFLCSQQEIEILPKEEVDIVTVTLNPHCTADDVHAK